ncbi:MAG: ABC transporter ATP-binding protein [Clostridiaceae bacterium]|nr:ABC transporter ATP-binding protein [Clostridiaceae bacterium]
MANPLVEVKDLTVYYGNTKALSNVNLEVEEGEYLGIIGPNGGGKTTLLKCIAGLLKYKTGTIRIRDRENTKIGYVPQFTNLDKSFPITLEEVVLSGMINPKLKPFYRYTQKEKDRAYELLEKVGISNLAKRQISELSGGEFQKMLIARALAQEPKLLLLDEPTASVDAKSRSQIYKLLGMLNEEMTIILVTHDLMAISSEVRSLACLNNTLVYHGEPEMNDTILTQMYGCPVDLIAHGIPHRVLRHHHNGAQEGGEEKC